MDAIVMMSPALERRERTLPFVASLPISYLKYTTAKIAGCLPIFLVQWIALVAGLVATILLTPWHAHGSVPFVDLMSAEILMSTCLVTTVAITTESQNWTVGSTQVGVLTFNGLGWWFVSLSGIRGTIRSATIQWSGTAKALIVGELALIGLMIAIAFFVQSRKTNFI
ncbi:MAG: hypothetical protein ABR905_18720 [Terracidiphilus sp.]|jgi:hypothetical protein